jgi:C1A family cysteine protease
MMKLALIALIFAIVAVSATALFTEQEFQSKFTDFMLKHEKSYEHNDFFYRFTVFKENLVAIHKHNADESQTFTVGMNEFGDLTSEEFNSMMKGYNHVENDYFRNLNTAETTATMAGADPIDWVAQGAVTPVKNQGQCGSCWAFSTTGSVEGANFIKSGTLQSYSEQQLVDCSGSAGNMGCNGGLMDNAFQWIIQNGGICLESDYPYNAVQGSCQTTCQNAGTVSTFTDVQKGSEDDLMTQLQSGPVSIAIDAAGTGFQFYQSGVYSKFCGKSLDHGVLLVGYGTDNGQNYWKIKNSWGATWGEQGYIRFIAGKDECGLALSASRPTA